MKIIHSLNIVFLFRNTILHKKIFVNLFISKHACEKHEYEKHACENIHTKKTHTCLENVQSNLLMS